jgi:hypothetical protein
MDPVVHFELPARDMSRARAFYEQVFGWTFNTYSDDYWLAYTAPVDEKFMLQKPGVINGALQKKDASIGTPRMVINVSNLDEAITKATAAGGKVLQPKTEVPGMLIYAVLQDTEGNECGIMQSIKDE